MTKFNYPPQPDEVPQPTEPTPAEYAASESVLRQAASNAVDAYPDYANKHGDDAKSILLTALFADGNEAEVNVLRADASAQVIVNSSASSGAAAELAGVYIADSGTAMVHGPDDSPIDPVKARAIANLVRASTPPPDLPGQLLS